MNNLRRFIALVIVSVSFSGCNLLNGRCLYELRNVVASGSVALTPTDSVLVELQETEQRDYEPNKDFSWQITGPSLKGHVQRIVLLPSSASSTPSFEFPLSGDNTPVLTSGFVHQSTGANINGFYDLLSSRTAIVRITTDIPGRTTVDVPLPNVQKTDWNRPYCS
ncbi:MAG TPA: hypothetical protein VF042_03665 [Gemmatimonadaceae bacterium]